jgi:hypothetical protein
MDTTQESNALRPIIPDINQIKPQSMAMGELCKKIIRNNMNIEEKMIPKLDKSNKITQHDIEQAMNACSVYLDAREKATLKDWA